VINFFYIKTVIAARDRKIKSLQKKVNELEEKEKRRNENEKS